MRPTLQAGPSARGQEPTGRPGRLRVVSPEAWNEIVARTRPGEVPEPWALWPALALLAIVLVWPQARRWGRTLVTIVHEAGHAAVGILVGRRFHGFVVGRDLSGHAVTSGRTRGAGRVLTTWAGYPAPAVLGALVALGAMRGWAGLILVLCLLLLAVLLVMSRSPRTAFLVILVGIAAGLLWWWGGPWRDGLVAGTGLILLVGAWDSLRDVARSRDGGQDHRTLAQLTPVPAGLWLATWFLADAAATAAVLLALRPILGPLAP
ncbi:M50 family metallopeptidase [Actinomyces bowdenii]|nr:M50 family metallopeptidase [Actinomyces bowdenii]